MESKGRVSQEDEVSLSDLMNIVQRAKWLIVILAPLFAGAAYFASQTFPKKYEASIIVSPATDSDGMSRLGGLGSIASQFGGLASLAGISLSGDTKRAETLAVLESEALTERYIDKNNLLPVLFPNLWDSTHQTWNTADPAKIPTLWKANQFFRKHVRSVSTDARTGLVTLTIRWKDAHEAAQWANGLVQMTNDYLRNKAITESERDIAYLNDQAAKTDLVGAKQAIYELLQNEINKAMLARGTEEYALKVLDPAQAPERPYFPRPAVWTVLGFVMGTLIALITTLMRTPVPSSQFRAQPLSPEAVAPR